MATWISRRVERQLHSSRFFLESTIATYSLLRRVAVRCLVASHFALRAELAEPLPAAWSRLPLETPFGIDSCRHDSSSANESDRVPGLPGENIEFVVIRCQDCGVHSRQFDGEAVGQRDTAEVGLQGSGRLPNMRSKVRVIDDAHSRKVRYRLQGPLRDPKPGENRKRLRRDSAREHSTPTPDRAELRIRFRPGSSRRNAIIALASRTKIKTWIPGQYLPFCGS